MMNFKQLESVLIYRLGALGDLVHTTGIVNFLRSQNADIKIDYITSSSFIGLFAHDPRFNRIYPLANTRLKSYIDLLTLLRKTHYDLFLNLQPNAKSFLLGMRIRKKQYLVYQKDRDYTMHAAENFLKTLGKLDVLPELSLEVPNQSSLNVDGNQSFIALIPTVSKGRPLKTWPETYYYQLAQELLHQTKYSLAIIGDAEAKPVGYLLKTLSPERVFDFTGILSLENLRFLLARCVYAIGGDTGPLHMADALNVKTIGLYGPSKMIRSKPFSQDNIVLTSSLDCLGCEKKTCQKTASRFPYAPCMENISPQDVLCLLSP